MAERSGSTIAIWLVAAALAAIAGLRLLGGGDAAAPSVRMGSGAPVTQSRKPGAELYVHVAGAVRRPGLIRLPPDSRVATALARAGGPTRRADLTLVNLAAKVQDGQQIVVPVEGRAAAPGAKVHLSTATADQLDEIDGIGPTLAERIVEYRDAHAGFRSVDELREVDGIGEQRLAALRDALQP
jgi:competence protein ComEA